MNNKDYTVIKDFGSAKVGDVIKKSTEVEDTYTIRTKENRTDDKARTSFYETKYIRFNTQYLKDLIALGYVKAEEDSKPTIIEFVADQIESYNKDLVEAEQAVMKGDITPCQYVERVTVDNNLLTLLNHINDTYCK